MTPRLISNRAGALAVVASVALALACGASHLGASEANLVQAKAAAAEGGEVFSAHCAGCHGERGEGTERGPAVIGAGALPTYPGDHNRATNSAFSDPQALEEEARARPAGAPSRDPFRTAADLHRYVSQEMPLPRKRAGSLAAAEYWSVVSFMLVAHGVAVPEGGVDAANATAVPLKSK